MPKTPNTNMAADLGKATSIDFVEKFAKNINELLKILGVYRKVPLTADAVLRRYKWKVQMANGEVGEGEEIPLSKVTREEMDLLPLKWSKHRRKVTAEAIARHGQQIAIVDGNTQVRRELQSDFNKKLIGFLGENPQKLKANSLQKALASTSGKLKMVEEFDESEFVYFINPEDATDYLGDNAVGANGSNIFGMTLLGNFLGIGNIISLRGIPKGKTYGTAVDNLILANLDMNATGLAGIFNLISDETGYISIGTETEMNTLTTDAVFLSVTQLYVEVPEGVFEATITPDKPAPEGTRMMAPADLEAFKAELQKEMEVIRAENEALKEQVDAATKPVEEKTTKPDTTK